MPSEVRQNFKKNCLIYVSKGVIWASEYSLGPQIWGPGGARAPGAPLDPLLQLQFQPHFDFGNSKKIKSWSDLV